MVHGIKKHAPKVFKKFIFFSLLPFRGSSSSLGKNLEVRHPLLIGNIQFNYVNNKKIAK